MTAIADFDLAPSHTVGTAKAGSIATEKTFAERLADMVVLALIDEVTLTPKPGLVDMRSRGAHRDLNWGLMCHSAWVLHPTFHSMAVAGQTITDACLLREEVGRIGRVGEAKMMAATGGVNTHRGAIWALGLLVTAAAQDQSVLTPDAVASRAASLARRYDQFAPSVTGNNGERACQVYGVGGARGQAQAGFPHVISVALPCLKHWRSRGESEDAARLNTLLSIIVKLDDTCVLARGGLNALAAIQADAHDVLRRGGAGSLEGKARLQVFEDQLLECHISPGGAADLLAATLFLDHLEKKSAACN